MIILKIPVYWTAEEADYVYQALGQLRDQIWEQYGQEIDHLYDKFKEDNVREGQGDFDDEIPF